jgi:hypothetical protein
MKNRKRETCTSGSVRDEDGNILIYSAAVLRENPPYGMIGGIEETSASFEARSAPRSHPTEPAIRPRAQLQLGRSCIGNDDRHNPSKTKLVESALHALEI